MSSSFIDEVLVVVLLVAFLAAPRSAPSADTR
jgi:hypothetical protein